MRYFVTVAEELHFGRAAQRLGISQPPLSQQIKALETELGAPLFDRSRHQVRLTSAGKAMLPECYRLLEQAERTRSAFGQHSGKATISLNVGCLSSALFGILPAIVQELRARHPPIALALRDVETVTGIAGLLEGRLDVALIRPEKVPPPLRMLPFFRDRMVAAIPSGHALAGRNRISLKDLDGEPLAVFARQQLPRSYESIIAACAAAGFRPNLAYHSPSIQSQLGSVACGLSIALVPGLVQTWAVPGVVYRDIGDDLKLPVLSFVWNASSQGDVVPLVLEAVKDRFGSLATSRTLAAVTGR